MPLVLGHRGARHAAPENTFKAFDLALAEGAAGVELDVRIDGSGEVVVIHDPRLERVSRYTRAGAVEDLNSKELRTVDVGDGERVPSLSDVLAWAREKNAFVNVEVKSDVRDRRRLLDAVVERMAFEREAADRLLLSSFHPGFVRELGNRLSPLPVCWLIHEKQGVFPFARGWQLLGARGVNPEHTLLSAAGVRRLKAQGALVNTWTVNEPILAAAYAAYGVDSIISDCPGAILAALVPRS